MEAEKMMIPFRVFDRTNKQMWQIINYHPSATTQGSYLAIREDDTESDGEMKIIKAEDLVKFKFVDFLDDSESYGEE
jgi:hypothetical protein